ncbi:MAG: protoporphyrinogen oxidase HemJ [Deltaproteobacteria bacterium]|nr:protoporphyrinogen oxidase HemJ [Deltaproteobacteria bacterium]
MENLLPNNFYLWLKAFHLIFMVAWFAGLFYIFRLFVYHARHQDEPKLAQVYTVMERKLLYIIIHPAMLMTILFGVLLISMNPSVLRAGWFHGKLAMVFGLIGYQILSGITYKRFAQKDFYLTEKQCRWINEIPTIFLIGIILLVVLKPGS